jgi:hypothetical protein
MSTFACRCGTTWRLDPDTERMLRVDIPPDADLDIDQCVIPDDYVLYNEINGALFVYFCCLCHRPYAILIYDQSTRKSTIFRPDHNDPNNPLS